MESVIVNGIDLRGAPLTVADVVHIVNQLCADGEVHVVNAAKSSTNAALVLSSMNSRLSDADKAWMKAAMAEAVTRRVVPRMLT